MKYFHLLGRPTLTFRVVKRYKVGNIPIVVGHTLDNKRQTVARVKDIEWEPEPKNLKKNPRKRRKKIKRKMTAKQLLYFGKGRIATKRKTRKRVRKTRLRKNPVGQFVIRASTANGRYMFYRHSTGSFIDSLNQATAYKSKILATRNARAMLRKLPIQIKGLTIHRI